MLLTCLLAVGIVMIYFGFDLTTRTTAECKVISVTSTMTSPAPLELWSVFVDVQSVTPSIHAIGHVNVAPDVTFTTSEYVSEWYHNSGPLPCDIMGSVNLQMYEITKLNTIQTIDNGELTISLIFMVFFGVLFALFASIFLCEIVFKSHLPKEKQK